jgi:hypothetical protein
MRNDDGTFEEPLWGDDDVITCFMEKIDFDYELGRNSAGNMLYPSPESCFRFEGSGMVEVEVRLKRVVEQTDFNKGKSYTPAEARQHEKKLNEDPDWIEYQRLREKFDRRWRHYLELRRQRKKSQDG